ncbi:MAG TPA: antibiotic biosynthesis monooxygenase family protein [Candidatus Angelobacter sp.]|nr:antibiotic biosynthesis monooxygenase family protein [Candidatus Angelobacter sp.]
MFTRVVEVTSKAGKARELTRTVNERVLPILKNQPGFLDEITLVSDEDPNRLLAISFWKSKEHAETYQREQYNKVTEIISNFLEGTPQVRTFEVEQSTVHKIASGRAA